MRRFDDPQAERGRVLLDVVIATAATLLAVYTSLDPPGPAYSGPLWGAWLVGVAAGAPLLLRRRWCVPVLAWVLLIAVVATLTGVVGAGAVWVIFVPVAVASYTVTDRVDRLAVAVSVLVLDLVVAATTIPAFYGIHRPADRDVGRSEVPLWWQVELGVVLAQLGAAWAAGWVVRSRRLAKAEFARRSVREAVADERLRVARELHDIVGHSMSVIAVEASVAGRLADERPDHAKAALNSIERSSRAAIGEIRQLLGVLRPAPDAAADAERGPLPGVADLPALVDRLRVPGLAIDLDSGGVDELSAGVDLAVYRVVQEALTNVVKHADATQCRIVVRDAEAAVYVDVVDDGPGRRIPRGRPGGGYGLIGMRERIATYGGTLAVGPRARGFQVAAVIPHIDSDAAP
ncbi:sensor histidine kinase [Amycolatopsis jiangsuensis]|uniref:histidine kinase n=1 Tax=Amycolatopsis jiangsuensis TaxID=1181879 RepID=A0A840IZ10_9PSEU|nr:histidine kinase [Amycolatopsis jiangsuensis]MBB4686749.1 signal transduction histidine kinase [Amycolatopsis jiangsuensis]